MIAFRFVVGLDSLTILHVTESDEGTYTCVMNTTLDQDSASAQLTVVGKDAVRYLLPSGTKNQSQRQ